MAITAVGESQSFAYTGTVQEFVVPVNGIYELKCVGGSCGGNRKGVGGTSIGYISLKKGTIIYVCVGGKGVQGSVTSAGLKKGGYNGGGDGYSSGGGHHGEGGGGATHMALMTGTLVDITIDNLDKILLIAGGGGGRYYDSNTNAGGGYGGGTSGTAGEYDSDSGNNRGAGGTQTSGHAFGLGESRSSGNTGSGGGGGLYGGKAASYGPGGGGSGYIGGVPEFIYNEETYTPSTTNGSGNSSGANGSAQITLMATTQSFTYPVYIGSVGIEKVYLGTTEINNILL